MDSSPSTSELAPRKRPRSQTEFALEPATTYKRGASEDAVMRSSPEAPQASSSTAADIDAYMTDQGEHDATPLDVEQSTASSSTAPSPSEQLMSIKALKAKPLKEGDTWCVVSKSWYTRWEDACSGHISKESNGPAVAGPIDNTDITEISPYPGKDYDLILNPPVAEGDTCEFIPKMAQDFLEQWYGPAKYPYEYTVTRSSPDRPDPIIELYPRRLRVYRIKADPLPPTYISVSRNLRITDLLTLLDVGPGVELTRFEVNRPWGDAAPLSSPEFWNSSPKDRKQILTKTPTAASLEQTVSDALLETNDSIVIRGGVNPAAAAVLTEPKTATEDPPLVPLFGQNEDYFLNMNKNTQTSLASTTSLTLTSAKTSTPSFVKPKYQPPPRAVGTVGLNNLGNTCFMNSALQCLAHLPELTEYFTRDVYKSELNPDNPLSTGGVLAKSYGDLVKNLFSQGASSSYAPRDFKQRIAMHAPQFSGYAQHDSQELVAFLLDGLHEDLNRVLKKPYVEKPEWEGGGPKEFLKLATDSWDGYMKRNDSVIVDLFQGQYKSTLVCPECKKISITFDPFMYLTLPLPIKKTWFHTAYFIPWDSSNSVYSTKIEIPNNSSVKTLKQKVATIFKTDASRLFAIDYFAGKWYKIYTDSDMVSEIGNNDKTVVYELPLPLSETASAENPTAPLIIPVYHRLKEARATSRYQNNLEKLFGIPTFVMIDQSKPVTQTSVYSTLVDQYKRWTSRPNDLYNWDLPDLPGDSSQDTQVEDLPNGHAEVAPDSQESVHAEGMESTATSETPAETTSEIEPDREPVILGPKPDLFELYLRESTDTNRNKSHWSFGQYDHSRPVYWSDRVVAGAPTPPDVDGLDITESGPTAHDPSEDMIEDLPPLVQVPEDSPIIQTEKVAAASSPFQLKPTDIICVTWEGTIPEYYFGDLSRGDSALWERFTPYEDREEAAAREADAEVRRRDAKKNITLEDCLDEFTKEELLGEDDLWYCPKCKKHQQATKQFQLWKVPDILVVHLKRFSNSRSLRDKIDALVEFPIEGLDLSNRVGEKLFGAEYEKETGSLEGTGLETVTHEPVIYDLFGVDEHMGGLGGGHYRAYALNQEDKQWYHFDDSHVSKARPEDSVTSSAYLLFYRKRSSTPIGGKTHDIIEAAKAKLVDSSESSESSVAQVSSTSITAFEQSSSTFSGPNFFGRQSPYSKPDDDLPSFEQSVHDRIITMDPGRGGRQAPSPTSSINSSLGANRSDSEDEPWIRTIGDDSERWPSGPSWMTGNVSDNGSEGEMERFGYSAMEGEEEAVDIDVSSPAFDIEL